MALMNQKKYFIHCIKTGNIVAQCNEWNIEQEKNKLPVGKYIVMSQNVDYTFEIKGDNYEDISVS